MPLSEHEQRILAEIERAVARRGPEVRPSGGLVVPRHLGRRLKLAVGRVRPRPGVVVSSTFFENVAIGVAGFVIMLACVFPVRG
jgi:hypothetical protein